MSNMKKVFLVDVGVLLEKGHHEYTCYDGVYDQKNAYFDENQYYKETLESAIAEARDYVKNGVERTYAVISEAFLPADENVEEAAVEDESYSAEDVVFSIAKIGGKIKENFVVTD